MKESKLANLSLYLLEAVNFDFQTILQIAQDVTYSPQTTWQVGTIEGFDKKRYKEQKQERFEHEKSFFEHVLTMKRDDKYNLVEIAPKFEMSQKSEYFHQFVGPIYEEIHTGLFQAYKTLATNRERKNSFGLKFLKWQIEQQEEEVKIQVIHCSINMAKDYLDHSPNTEVVRITFTCNNCTIQLRGILTDFQIDYETHSYYDTCKLNILTSDCNANASFFGAGNICQVNILLGVLNYSRMLETVKYPPKSALVDTIVTGSLPNWSPLVDGHRPSYLDAVARSLITTANAQLNVLQAEVISEFADATQGLFLLQGPPGTGKMIRHILECNPNQRIMICAPSNAAVHTLAERAIAVLGTDVSMVFRGIDKELSKEMRSIYSDGIANRLIGAIKRFINLDKLQYMKNITLPGIKHFTKELINMISEHEDFFANIKARFISVGDSQINQLRFNFKVEVKIAVLDLLNKIPDHLGAIRTLLNDLSKIVFEHQQPAQPVSRTPQMSIGPQPSQSQRKALQKKNAQLMKQFSTIHAALIPVLEDYRASIEKCASTHINESYLKVFMLTQSQLIFNTLSSCSAKILRKLVHKMDVLIIDEAGQAVEPELLMPFYYQPKKCLQVGDNNQLPATVLSPANRNLKYDQSMMARLIERAGATSKMLQIPYRMHSAICAWPSIMYYEACLVPDDSLYTRQAILQDTNVCEALHTPCVFVDVAGGEDSGKYSGDNSYSNEAEAAFAVEIVQHLLRNGVHSESIGVIAFYSSQVRLLKGKMKDFQTPVKVRTVDGFQGMEQDIIILCTTRTCKSAGFLDDYRRLNVAVTRAKHNLYVLGKRSTLVESNTDLSNLIPFYDEIQDCAIIDSRALLSQLN